MFLINMFVFNFVQKFELVSVIFSITILGNCIRHIKIVQRTSENYVSSHSEIYKFINHQPKYKNKKYVTNYYVVAFKLSR